MKYSILFFSLLLIVACKETADFNPVSSGLYKKYFGNGELRDALSGVPEGRTMNLTTDNSLIGVGTVALRNINDSIISKAYLFKLDLNGLLTKDVLIGDAYINVAVDLAANGNGDHYLLLNTVGITSGEMVGMQIVKISDALETEWTNEYDLQTKNQGRALSVDDEGNIIVLGNYFPDNIISGGAGRSKMFTAKISPEGDPMWVDSLGVNNESNPVGKTINVYTDGNQRYAWCGDDMNKSQVKPKLIVTDEDGNIWQNSGVDADADSREEGSELLRTDNGTFLIVGTIEINNNMQMRLVRLSNNGDLLWTQNYGGDQNETGVSVCEAEDKAGKFIVNRVN